jgi:hypothetical protein
MMLVIVIDHEQTHHHHTGEYAACEAKKNIGNINRSKKAGDQHKQS